MGVKKNCSCTYTNMKHYFQMAEGGCSDKILRVTKRQEFADKLLDQFQVMQDQEYLTDFLLKVDEKEIACHKVVLASRCEYFHALFSHKDIREVKQGSVNFPTLHFPALKLVVKYFYSGILECNMDDAKYVIEIIEHLQIPDLKDDLSELILSHMTADNCIGWYFVAKLYGMTAVKEKSQQFMLIDFPNTVRSSEFLELDYDDLIDYIMWDGMDHSSTLVAAARWVMRYAEQRRNKFPDILKTINIKQCCASAMKYIATKYESLLTTGQDTSEKLITAARSDVPEWHEPWPGAGYHIIVLGGRIKTKSWMINLLTGETHETTSIRNIIYSTNARAMCTTSTGALFTTEGKIDGATDSKLHCIAYQKESNSWTIIPKCLPECKHASAVCIDMKVYVIGGLKEYKKMHCLDMTHMTWRHCPDLLQGLILPVVGSLGDCIYVIFSTHPDNEITSQGLTLQCYDTTLSSWSFKASLPEAVTKTDGATTVSVDYRMFVIGGFDSICMSYNTRNDVWTMLTPSHRAHFHGAALYFKGRIIVSGGGDMYFRQRSNNIESYDPATNTWILLPVKLPRKLIHHCIIPA